MPAIYYNCNIITMDEVCPKVQAILVDDGKIKKETRMKKACLH